MNDSDVKALHIETMRHEDLEAVLEIENASFPTPWSRQLFIEELQNHRSRIFLLRSPLHGPDALKAYVCLWLVEDEAHILNLAVNPLCRRQGMAATVLYYALDYSFKNKSTRVFLEVREHNAPARSLYKKFRFRRTGVRPRYYRDTGEDALIMELDLNRFFRSSPAVNEKSDCEQRFLATAAKELI